MEQINLIVPLIMSAVLFGITQLTKKYGWFKGKNPNFILYPVAVVSVFIVASIFDQSLTLEKIYEMSAMFAGGAGAFHVSKKALGQLMLFVIDLLSAKRGE